MATTEYQQLEKPGYWSSHYNDEAKADVINIIDFLNDQKMSRSSMARRIDAARNTVSPLLAGKYNANPTSMIEKMKQVMHRKKLEAEMPKLAAGSVIETSMVKLMRAACDRAIRYRKFAVVSAFVGTGKTEAARLYCRDNSDSIIVDGTSNMTPAVLIDQILIKLGESVYKRNKTKGSVAEREAKIINVLSGRDFLIILDEAETVADNSLEKVRRISDIAKIGVVLTGTTSLRAQVRDPDGRFGQISSRVIFWPPVVNAINLDDVEKLLRLHFPERELNSSIVDAFNEMCDGSARVLCDSLVTGVKDYGLNAGHELSAELVYKVGQDVLGYDAPKKL